MQKSYLVPLAEPPAGDRMTFVTVMNFALRNLRFMLIGGVILAVISPLPLIGRAPKYTATTRFVTEAERPAGGFLGDLNLPGTAGRGPDFYLELMRSPVVLEGVARTPIEIQPGKPPVSPVAWYYPGPQTDTLGLIRGVAGKIGGMITTGTSGPGIVTLRVTAEDPYLAAALARSLIQQTDEFNETKMRSQAAHEREFAERRLTEVESELHAAESDWLAFQRRNRIVSAPELQLEQSRLSDTLSRKRGLASMLVQAIERARLDEVRETPRAVILAPPVPPGGPSNISWLRVAIVGFFAGMLVAAFLALVRDYFRHVSSLRTPESAEFATLRAASGAQIGKPLRAIVSAVTRKPPRPTQLQ